MRSGGVKKLVGKQVGWSVSVVTFLLFGLFLLSAFTPKPIAVHDFHTSLTEIDYNPKTKSLEMTIRVFTDDLERALTEINNGKLVKIDPNDYATDPLIFQYLRKHVAFVSPDKDVVAYDFLGKEVELDATWLYVELPAAANLKGYSIFNSILTELFDDQINLLNLIYPDKKKSFVFDNKIKVATYPF
jgi:hypothetical protein